ncbi:MAG: hypothetical protein ND807_00970 [Vicinamibacterales bacterium]|nr:hypothetical protein [Vicinamibacterales bacterium]
MSVRRTLVFALSVVCLTTAAASAQTIPATTPATPEEQSRLWLVIGGGFTTLRGDCQEDCPVHGQGAYWHTGNFTSNVGYRVNKQMDAGVEVSWVPVTTKGGDEVRSTFVLTVAQFRPWESHGFFLKGGMGMAFVRNFVYSDSTSTVPPLTSKALGLTYGAGWVFQGTEHLGLQIVGTQQVSALGDFQTGGVSIANVIVNVWSFGAAVVIR